MFLSISQHHLTRLGRSGCTEYEGHKGSRALVFQHTRSARRGDGRTLASTQDASPGRAIEGTVEIIEIGHPSDEQCLGEWLLGPVQVACPRRRRALQRAVPRHEQCSCCQRRRHPATPRAWDLGRVPVHHPTAPHAPGARDSISLAAAPPPRRAAGTRHGGHLAAGECSR